MLSSDDAKTYRRYLQKRPTKGTNERDQLTGTPALKRCFSAMTLPKNWGRPPREWPKYRVLAPRLHIQRVMWTLSSFYADFQFCVQHDSFVTQFTSTRMTKISCPLHRGCTYIRTESWVSHVTHELKPINVSHANVPNIVSLHRGRIFNDWYGHFMWILSSMWDMTHSWRNFPPHEWPKYGVLAPRLHHNTIASYTRHVAHTT